MNPNDMSPIEYIKFEGAKTALREAIGRCQHQLRNNVWDGTSGSVYYRKLGAAITNAEQILREMRGLLAALHDLDERNK
jgi:hypothetical protein